MSSSHSVNYSIRPNKTIERKVVFSCLVELARTFPISDYRYIGMGSMWFVDFLLAHKALRITRMTSMERYGFPSDRARFNVPLGCIDVEDGDSTLILPRLSLSKAPVLAWLDYDGSLNSSALADIVILVDQSAVNSILIVTINARKESLPANDENDETLTDEQRVRRFVGDLLPVPVDPRSFQPKNYPKLVCKILEDRFQRAIVNSGRREVFVKLFDIVYADGPPMATIGGILVDQAQAAMVQTLASSDEWEGMPNDAINAPALTIKEKITLDRLLPSNTALEASEIEATGLKLKPEQVEAYRRFYRQYPIFGEFAF